MQCIVTLGIFIPTFLLLSLHFFLASPCPQLEKYPHQFMFTLQFHLKSWRNSSHRIILLLCDVCFSSDLWKHFKLCNWWKRDAKGRKGGREGRKAEERQRRNDGGRTLELTASEQESFQITPIRVRWSVSNTGQMLLLYKFSKRTPYNYPTTNSRKYTCCIVRGSVQPEVSLTYALKWLFLADSQYFILKWTFTTRHSIWVDNLQQYS